MIFATAGILLALLFVTLPLVVRTVQPILLELDEAEEEAARVLGAIPLDDVPQGRPARNSCAGITGGRTPRVRSRARRVRRGRDRVRATSSSKTLTAPVFIFQLIGGFKTNDAAAIATLLFAVSFAARADHRAPRRTERWVDDERGRSRTPVLSSPLRRKLVHGGLIAVAVLYVGALVLAPLIGIAWAAINAGWDAWKATLTDPDAIHAYYLTAGITVVTVVVTGIFGVIVAHGPGARPLPGQEHS